MLQPALFGGLFIGVLSALPVINIGNCCCLWFTGGGFLAAYLCQQNEPGRNLTLGRGAFAGLLAAVAGAFVWLIVNSLVQVAFAGVFQEWIYDLLQNVNDMPPETRTFLESLAEDGGSPFWTAVAFLYQLCMGAVFATLGGLAGAAYFRRDVPPALGGPAPPPPLP